MYWAASSEPRQTLSHRSLGRFLVPPLFSAGISVKESNFTVVEYDEQLKKIAGQMLGQAASKHIDGLYMATGFRTDNISILHQQERCANFAWALNVHKKIASGDVVVIVGAGFSGMMLSILLSITTRCIIYLFEREPLLLSKYRSSIAATYLWALTLVIRLVFMTHQY